MQTNYFIQRVKRAAFKQIKIKAKIFFNDKKKNIFCNEKTKQF